MRRTERTIALHSICSALLATLTVAACGSSTPTQLSQAIDGPGILSPEALANTPLGDTNPLSEGDVTACLEVADCDDANPCTDDQCIEGSCERAPLPLTQCCQETPLSFYAFDPESSDVLKVYGSSGS